MSDIYNVAVLRFRLASSNITTNQALNLFRGMLGEPKEIEYKSEWNGETFVVTDKVDYFLYDNKKGKYVPRQADNGDWFLDYLLDGEKESSDGLTISESLDNLKQIEVETYNNFSTQLKRGCKLKVYDWYSGSDMPVTW